MHKVYIIFAGPSVYIGRSKDIIVRLRNHKMLYCDWAVLEMVPIEQIRACERKWVKYFIERESDVLNIDKGCDHPGILQFSREHCQKIGNALRGRKKGPLSEETRHLLSQIMSGRKILWGNKISRTKMGHQVSAETRSKLSRVLTGRKLPPRLRKAYCKRGHPRIPQNLRRRACKKCEAILRRCS